jgi:hypothetical protein
MREVSEPGLIATLHPLLEEAKTHALVIRDGDTELGAIVSMEDYEIVRKAKVERFLRISAEFGEHLRARALEEGMTVDELEKMLDRKAS